MNPLNGKRRCPQTLDRPITILGMEPGELVLVGLVAGAVMFLIDPVAAVAVGVVIAFGLGRLRRGRPPGALFSLYYRSGWAAWMPPFLRVPNLLPPPVPGRPRAIRLSPFSGKELTHVEELYWHERDAFRS